MFTLKDEFRSIPPATEKGRRRRKPREDVAKRRASHISPEGDECAKSRKLEELLLAERTRSAAFEQQLSKQTALLAAFVSQREASARGLLLEKEGSMSPMARLARLQGRVLEAVDVIGAKAVAKSRLQDAELETVCIQRVQTAREPLTKEIDYLKQQLAAKEQALAELSAVASELKAGWSRSAEDCARYGKQVAELKQQVETSELAKAMLHKQILDLKRANQQLVTDRTRSPSPAPSPLAVPLRKSAMPTRPTRSLHEDGAVLHLQHLLDLERKSLRGAKAALATELRLRARLEASLKDAVSLTSAEIDTLKAQGAGDLAEVLEKQKRLLETLRDHAAGLSSSYQGLNLALQSC